MGRQLQKTCEVCQKTMRSDKITKHMQSHERREGIVKKKVERENKAKCLLDQLLMTIGTANLDMMLHVYHRTDCYSEGKNKENVQEHFIIPHKVICECGTTRDTSHPHAHFVGEFQGQSTHYGRTLGQVFTEPKAFQCKKLKGVSTGTIKEKIRQIKHFLNVACYIQTERGWHKKTLQENPHVFPTLEDNRKFLAKLYGEWMWAQVDYMRYLMKKIEDKERLLEHGNITEEQRLDISRQIEDIDEKLQDLEKTWGEEHHHGDDEMEEDLDKFIKLCKEKGASLTS
jgi:hypothetical protein